MTSRDRRSVGELLVDCEHVARDALWDVDQMRAGTMLGTWGEVVQSATDLWHALPANTPPDPITGVLAKDSADITMERLQAMTTALHRSTRGQPWPGEGPADERLLRIAENLTRAADLVTRFGAVRRPLSEPVRGDLDAAKARIMHILYVGSHGVALAVGHHLRDIEGSQRAGPHIAQGQSLHAGRAAHARLAAFEQIAGSYVARTYPRDLAGEHREPPKHDRLAQALANWDVQAHRSLAASTRTADLMLASATQALIAEAGSVLLRAAATAGLIDPEHYRARLGTALDSAQEGWTAMAALWQNLTPPSARRAEPGLGLAAQEARAAIYEIIHDRAGLASPELIANRADLAHTAQTIQQTLSTSVDLAHVIRDATTRHDLTAPARAVNAVATRIHETRGHAIDSSPMAAWVSPRDHATNRAVPLLDTVRASLTEAAERVVEASATAMSAAAILDHATRPRDGAAPASPGREAQVRTPQTTSGHTPAPCCGR